MYPQVHREPKLVEFGNVAVREDGLKAKLGVYERK